MIEITAQQFQQLLPFVGAASEDVFDNMQPSFERIYQDLVATVIGSDHEDAACTDESPMLDNIRSYIILKTFILRLRSNDLIMTDNGFGVVANDNISPASQARVEALLQELTYKQDLNLQGIINRLRTLPGWGETIQASNNIASFFWSPERFKSFVTAIGFVTFDTINAHRAEIDKAELFLRRQFSDSLIEQLLSEERTAHYEPSHRVCINKMCHFIAANISIDGKPIDLRCSDMAYDAIANFIDENIENFPKYVNSSAFQANHTPAYENKSSDSTFFFG